MPSSHAAASAPSRQISHKDMANVIRALSMDAVQKAKSGHPGMPMGMADAATVLFGKFLRFDPSRPTWPDRDRFVLSAGHGSMLRRPCPSACRDGHNWPSAPRPSTGRG